LILRSLSMAVKSLNILGLITLLEKNTIFTQIEH
jgi:hypothetical protein